MTDTASYTAEDTIEWGYTAKDIANNHTRDNIVEWRRQCQIYSGEYLDVVEAHCYVVDIGRTDCEQIRSRINNN